MTTNITKVTLRKQETQFRAKHAMIYSKHCHPLLCFQLVVQSALKKRQDTFSVDCTEQTAVFQTLPLLSFTCLEANMSYRTVVMYMEIGCFVVCVCGWILVCSTMPTEIWTWSEVDSIVLTTSNYFSNLWKDCISDSTGVSDCKGIPSMLALHCKLNEIVVCLSCTL